MTEQNSDTKVKIMEAARILFSDQGFEGTSTRDIAKTAEVNVASINYHFSSKEKLFAEILEAGYHECGQEMRKLYEKNNGNLENTLIGIFHYFLENSHDLITHFKMKLSSQHSHHLITNSSEDSMYGPPGGMVIAQALKKEVGKRVSDEDLHWALKTLFSHVTHISIINTCCVKTNSQIPYSTVPDFEKSIRRLTRIVISELKSFNL